MRLDNRESGSTNRHAVRPNVNAIQDMLDRRNTDFVAASSYRRLATDQAVASLLFHRQDRRDGAGIHRLRRHLAVVERTDGHGELYYSLARAMARRRRAEPPTKTQRLEIERLLKKSLRDGESSRFQLQRREPAFGRSPRGAALALIRSKSLSLNMYGKHRTYWANLEIGYGFRDVG